MNCSSGHFFAMVKRFQSFSQMSFSRMGQVIMSHHFKLRSSIADIYKALNNYSMYPSKIQEIRR
ncbi:hypothetical protein ZEAMMB73_Zm00001d028929 [Zea mays]|uniref:Uncharacterized protein n=1 Tax=Zea mays TaxID=4577 RepID=A0A1D6K0Z6_MAIZE|nr:hypothetical protein ZEAMMB73_Zm00001d028929 [Zea mays]